MVTDGTTNSVEQKLAEKISILNDRGVGLLTRIYNIKKACSDPKSRPVFLGEKSLEPALKILVKKFPLMENNNAPHMQGVMERHLEVVEGLHNYYATFVDILLFKDRVSELLNSIDANFVHFDIALNFDLTKTYCSLITTYACIFALIAKVDDRKAVLSLFNHAYEMQKGNGEHNFPRLGQMILDYEHPFKKLSQEFTSHAERIGIALNSLNLLYKRRSLGGDQMRIGQLLSLTSVPQQMLDPPVSETVPCEYLSLGELTRWILVACSLCPSQITGQASTLEVWKSCLQDGFCITLFRDEVWYIHKDLPQLFEGIKGGNKRGKEIQDCLALALQHSAAFHRERRRYLQTALEEIISIFSDQPGLLGPKVLIALLALSLARDEVHWLIRHKNHVPPKGKKFVLDDTEDDGRLPQFLHTILELRQLFKNHETVVQRYFVQYLSDYDCASLKTIIQRISVCPDEESLIMTDFVETLSVLNVEQVDTMGAFDFRGLRLDWMRLQAYTSTIGSVPELKENKDLAVLMNTIVLHTKLVDSMDDILKEVSDLSIFCFYPSFFEANFKSCLENPGTMRFSIAYPLVCTHFLSSTHNLCPEERHPIGERSLSAVNSSLDAISVKAKHYISQLCEEHLRLSKQLDPGNAVNFHTILEESKSKIRPKPTPPKPGQESRKKTVETRKPIDNKFQGQVDLLQSLAHCINITVWDHVFTPREYLVIHLEDFFRKTVLRLLNFNEATNEIARPSSLVQDIKSFIYTLHRLEKLINFDIGRIVNAILLQHTLDCDENGGRTLTGAYTFWYNEVLLKKILTNSSKGIVYVPSRMSFVNLKKEICPKVEEYSDICEMRNLAELLGAYGVRHFSRKLVQRIVEEVEELKKVVLVNKEILASVVENLLSYDVLDVLKKVKNFDELISRTVSVGMFLIFRLMINTGLRDVLPKKVPYLMKILDDFEERNTMTDSTLIHEMAQAAGINSEFDAELYQGLRDSREKNEGEGIVWEYLMAFWGVSLSALATRDTAEYNSVYEANENNAHLFSIVLNMLPQALFTVTGDNVNEKMKMFLKIATTGLLQLGLDQGAQASKETSPKQRASAYIVLDLIVKESVYLSEEELDMLFPYCLVRDAYNEVYKKHRKYVVPKRGAPPQPQELEEEE